MNRLFLCAVFAALPTFAAADSRLDRFEELSEQTSKEMPKIFIRAIEEKGGDTSALQDALPEAEWDDAHREAGACMLVKYDDLIGKDGVDDMMTRMEEIIPQLETATLDTIGTFNATPDSITTEQSAAIMQECSMMELVLKRMKDSGYSDAIMKAYATVPSGN